MRCVPSSGSVAATGRIGYVPQQPALWRRLTVRENLRLVAQLAGHDGIEQVLAANALAEIADRRVASCRSARPSARTLPPA